MKVSWEYQTGTRQDADEWICDLRVVLTAEERDTLRLYCSQVGHLVMADYVTWTLRDIMAHVLRFFPGRMHRAWHNDLVTAETIPNDAK